MKGSSSGTGLKKTSAPAKLEGRPHLVALRAPRGYARYEVVEVNTGDVRATGQLGPRDKEIRFSVKGGFILRSNALASLEVRVDEVLYPPEDLGSSPVRFPDLDSVPPPPPPPVKKSHR